MMKQEIEQEKTEQPETHLVTPEIEKEGTTPPVSPPNQEEKEKPTPNVKFVGKRLYLDKKTGERRSELARPEDIPTQRINGQYVFDLPSGKEQLKGFYHEEAAKLVQFYGSKFKPIVNKGEKR